MNLLKMQERGNSGCFTIGTKSAIISSKAKQTLHKVHGRNFHFRNRNSAGKVTLHYGRNTAKSIPFLEQIDTGTAQGDKTIDGGKCLP